MKTQKSTTCNGFYPLSKNGSNVAFTINFKHPVINFNLYSAYS